MAEMKDEEKRPVDNKIFIENEDLDKNQTGFFFVRTIDENQGASLKINTEDKSSSVVHITVPECPKSLVKNQNEPFENKLLCDKKLMSNKNEKFFVEDKSSKVPIEDKKLSTNRKMSREDLGEIIENKSVVEYKKQSVVASKKLTKGHKHTQIKKTSKKQERIIQNDPKKIPNKSMQVKKEKLKNLKTSAKKVVFSASHTLLKEVRSFVKKEMLFRSKIKSRNQEKGSNNIKESNIRNFFDENQICPVSTKMLSRTIETQPRKEIPAENQRIEMNIKKFLSTSVRGKISEECEKFNDQLQKIINKYEKMPVKFQKLLKIENVVEVQRKLAKKKRQATCLKTQNQSDNFATENKSRSIVKENRIVETEMFCINQVTPIDNKSEVQKTVKNEREYFENEQKLVERMQLKNDETTLDQREEKTCPTIYDVLHLIIASNIATYKEVYHLCDVIGILVKQEKLNFIVLNLYCLRDGFTVSAKAEKETFLCKMSYENLSYLEEIDRGEIPMKLLWMLKGLKEEFMYDRYFIMQVNDFVTKSSLMQKKIPPCFSFFKLLKLSYETLKAIIEKGAARRIRNRETVIEKNTAAILVQYSDPLCLDPTPVSLQEHFQMKTNSFSNPELQEVLQKKLHLTLAQTRNFRCPSGFSEFIKTMKTLKVESTDLMCDDFESSVLAYVDDFWDKPYTKASVVECAPSFETYLNNRKLKIMPRPKNKSPVLVEEFAFHCLKVDKDGKEVLQSDFLSVFHTVQTEMFYVKVYYSTHIKNTRPKQNCFKLSSIAELNKCILKHAKVLTNGWTNKFKVFHQVPSCVRQVVFNNIPVEFKVPTEYRESGDCSDITASTMTEA